MTRPGTDKPCTRDDLDVNEVPDGLIVYDIEKDRVHYLNATAAVVFCTCTGEFDEAGIAAQVQEAFGLEQPPLTETAECIATFADQGLLV